MIAAAASFIETRRIAGPISASTIRFGRSFSTMSVTRKAINCKASVTGPQMSTSQTLMLLAILKAKGSARPIMAPDNETAAAVFPPRISLISS